MDSENHDVTFSPLISRRSQNSMVTVAVLDIKAGEEILLDDGELRTERDSEFEMFLQNVCVILERV